jgi:hypothetical protein
LAQASCEGRFAAQLPIRRVPSCLPQALDRLKGEYGTSANDTPNRFTGIFMFNVPLVEDYFSAAT